MSEEDLMEKRFGVVAIEKGFITRDQLLEVLEIQIDEEIEHGRVVATAVLAPVA